VTFAHLRERIDDAPAHQPKIAGIERDIDLRQPADEPIKQPRRDALEEPLPFARAADRVDDVIPFAPFGDEVDDQLGRILQVAVHQDHRVAARRLEPGGRGELVPEVARQVDDDELAHRPRDPAQCGERPVRAPVVDEDELVLGAALDALHDPRDAPRKLFDVPFFVVHGDDDADHGCGASSPLRKDSRTACQKSGKSNS